LTSQTTVTYQRHGLQHIGRPVFTFSVCNLTVEVARRER